MRFLALLFASVFLPLVLASPVVPSDPGPAPVLQNPGFECGDGYHDQAGVHGMVPNGWTAVVLKNPDLFTVSTQLWAKTGGCDVTDMSWEKLEGYDSNIFMASWAKFGDDFAGPPFDIALYQPVRVTPGIAYSLSAWMTSLCGGSSNPTDCPEGYYIAKMAGLDVTNGTDPTAGSVQWTEDRRPHTEARWANLVTAATATGPSLTVFLRINSPFEHHGNHVFADAVKLVHAPTSRFTGLSAAGSAIALAWDGSLEADIPALKGTHELSFEIERRAGDDAWQPWLTGQARGATTFTAPRLCEDQTYQFRLRPWAIQPPNQPGGPVGSWPNHRFVGVWKESSKVTIPATPAPCQR